MATFTKPPFFLKVVYKLFQFKTIIVNEPGLRFLPVDTFNESGVLPLKLTLRIILESFCNSHILNSRVKKISCVQCSQIQTALEL